MDNISIILALEPLISSLENFFLKIFLKRFHGICLNFTNIEAVILEEKALANNFGKKGPSAEKDGCKTNS